MREEARNTDRQAHIWANTSLRNKGISFVSAGPLKREEDAWNTVSEGESPAKKSDSEQPELPVEQDDKPGDPAPASKPAQAETKQNGESDPSLCSQHLPTSVEHAPSTSDSEEEIVFSGRAPGSRRSSRKPTPAPTQAVQLTLQPKISPSKQDNVQAEPLPSPEVPAPKVQPDKTLPKLVTPNPAGSDAPIEAATPPTTKPKRRDKRPFGRKYNEDELMQDYIDNMALDDSEEEEDTSSGQGARRKPFKKTETFRMFNGHGLENEKVQTNGKKNPSAYIAAQAIDWDSDDLADFDDLSTTDEEVEEIAQVIRHRSRESGPQYLVVAVGAEANDAKWMLHSKLISESAVKEIEIYEEIRNMNIEESDLDDDDEDSEEDEDEEVLRDLVDDIESEDDENARIMKYTARMTDEQIARALAKQEELGLGGDELMIFDGEAAEQDDAKTDVFGGGDDFIPFNLARHTSNRGRSKRNKKQRDSFPSAEAFADALDQDPHGAFDIMDFDRPSLKPKKKGRKSDYPWDLGDLDEDLREQLVNTWTKDREKKAERKRQKEEARLAASLDAEDGSDPAIIKARIRQFLVQDVDTLKLSPMDSEIRKCVHRLAKTLHLLSRSEGKDGVGAGRYPVLTKTPRTPYYTTETIWEVEGLMDARKYFPKHVYGRSKKTFRASGAARPRRMGGGAMSGATYRDGDEVGGSAPEIGSDNKGRAMLEKMGWTAGMAIGAEGNKGSLDHVKHIVKTTKAGLG